MKIDLELKSGTSRDVVSSLRKIVCLPVDYDQRVELSKRLLLDFISSDGGVPVVRKAGRPRGRVDRVFDREQINRSSRAWDRHNLTVAASVGSLAGGYNHTVEEQVCIAGLLEDAYWFAWGKSLHGSGRLLLLGWPVRFGDVPFVRSNIELLTGWTLGVPAIPADV